MLFTIAKPHTPGIYWLDRVVTSFFQNLFAGHEFDHAMFPVEFAPVLNDSPKTLRKFRDVHIAFTALGLNSKITYQSIYNNHRDLVEYLADENYQVDRINDELLTIWAKTKELATLLYKTTINLVCYENIQHVTDNMYIHFETFRLLNGSVCCFCGIEPYEVERIINEENGDEQWRADYDHYLFKKEYPFNSVNFDNLFPCCHTCNKKAKNEKDIVIHENVRVPAFHPYLDVEVANIEVTYLPNDRKWTVALPDGNALLNKKIHNWDRIYLVTSRACKLINDSFEETWFAPVASGKTNANEIRLAVQRMSVIYNARLRIEREAYYKEKCFQAILQISDAELEIMATTVNELYAGRVI